MRYLASFVVYDRRIANSEFAARGFVSAIRSALKKEN